MLTRLIDYFRPPPIADRRQLEAFLSGEASYLAQRSTYEYSRNTLGYFGQHAFGDDRFNEAMRLCRWESFAAVLADMVVLTEFQTRISAGDRADALPEALADVYRAVLAAYPLPAHRESGWEADVAGLHRRLREAPNKAPPNAADTARTAARRVYKVLPVYSPNARADYDAIEGAIRFGIISFDDRLRERLLPRGVIADLLAGAVAPQPGPGP